MRWDNLFDDLESQLEQGISAEELDLGAEEERLRIGRLTMRDRLEAVHESGTGDARGVAVTLANDLRLVLRPVTFGRDWFSADIIDDSSRRAQCIVPLAAVSGLGLSAGQVAASVRVTAKAEHPPLSSRLSVSFVLRDLCRRRRSLTVVLAVGEWHGTIDRVGREHLDLAVHEQGSARRDSAVLEYRVIPLDRIVLVRL
ncbi:MAG: hypothetical protein EPN91_12440 [Salinibacterium sp.]|nr:MAG: hypothetical protein EPN91_12440 [Salinibacterium sp.]